MHWVRARAHARSALTPEPPDTPQADPEAFLSTFLESKAWRVSEFEAREGPSDDDDDAASADADGVRAPPDDEEDEAEVERAEAFETKCVRARAHTRNTSRHSSAVRAQLALTPPTPPSRAPPAGTISGSRTPRARRL